MAAKNPCLVAPGGDGLEKPALLTRCCPDGLSQDRIDDGRVSRNGGPLVVRGLVGEEQALLCEEFEQLERAQVAWRREVAGLDERRARKALLEAWYREIPVTSRICR